MNGVLKIATLVAAVLALAGLGAAAFFGFSWWSAERAAANSVAKVRDEALQAAQQLSVTFQTSDPAQPEQGYQAWENGATGSYLARLQQDRPKFLAQLKAKPVRSTAVLKDAALTELDPEQGTATALVALDVSQATANGSAAGSENAQHTFLKLSLKETDDGWKVVGISPVKS